MAKTQARFACQQCGAVAPRWAGPVDQIDRSGNEYLDQFINGRPEGPIQLQVRAL